MRLIASLAAAALFGLAAGASPQSADVYLLQSSPSQSSPETPSIPKEVARHILLQRTSRHRYGSDLRDIPSSDADAAVDHIATFGKGPAPLFTSSDKTEPSQLVVILEGGTAEQSSQLRGKLGQTAAFTISNPPSATANNQLMGLFRNLGVASSQQCDLSSVINPFETDCWTGPSSAVKYDLQKSPETFDSLLSSLPRLNNFVSDGDLEVLLVLLPESSRSSKLTHWSAAAAGAGADLRRRRDAEAVLSGHDTFNANNEPATDSAAPPPTGKKTKAKPIPQCFTSLNSCTNQTNSCSGHGECVNKYGGGSNSSASDSDSAPACFVCVCKASIVERPSAGPTQGRKTVHWGGNMCQKEDVSVQFWLIAGFTVTIVGVVTFAIGLLYSVGEETLPGVIGAGVSRSK